MYRQQAQCVKTGASVYLQEYDQWVTTDLMELGDVYFFLVLTEDHITRRPTQSVRHMTVEECGIPIPRRGAPYTLVAHRSCCVNHGYEGLAES